MNKTININLGGYPFTIDEDAYATASHYLDALTAHFSGSDGDTEIMQDIETRMGELVHRTKGSRVIVNKVDILEAISVLGTPEELKDIDFSEATNKERKKKTNSFTLKTGKRLFRDPDDKIISGVCSGLASYLGIQDAVWVRIGFVLLTMLGGASVMVYVVLWAIIPEARTVSDRLEMMGEPTNVNNIAKMVKDELGELSDKIQETFAKKSKKYHHTSTPPSHDEDDDQPLTSGFSWRSKVKSCRKAEAGYNHKDFV